MEFIAQQSYGYQRTVEFVSRYYEFLKKYDCDSCNFSVDVNTNPITCKNSDNGEAILIFSSGTATHYNIVWSNALTADTLQNLAPGFYEATVTHTLKRSVRVLHMQQTHNPDSH